MAIFLILFLFSKTVTSQNDYPLPLTEDTYVQVGNDTLWVLTDNQYMQCLWNTEDLIDAYKTIDLLEKNAIDQDSINTKLKRDLALMELEYFKTYEAYEREKRRKKGWRSAAIIEAPFVILPHFIFWRK